MFRTRWQTQRNDKRHPFEIIFDTQRSKETLEAGIHPNAEKVMVTNAETFRGTARPSITFVIRVESHICQSQD